MGEVHDTVHRTRSHDPFYVPCKIDGAMIIVEQLSQEEVQLFWQRLPTVELAIPTSNASRVNARFKRHKTNRMDHQDTATFCIFPAHESLAISSLSNPSIA